MGYKFLIKDEKLIGMFLAGLGIFIFSFDALFIKLVNASASTITFYRGLFMGLSMFLVWKLSSKRSWKPTNKKELQLFIFIVFLSAMSTSLFVFSVKYTVAANTVVFLATSSFFAAIFTFFLIKEKLQKSTLLAIIISFIGVLIVFRGSFSIGNNIIGDLLGVLLALVMGLELTLLRKYSHFPHMLIIALSGFLTAFIIFIFNDISFALSSESFSWLLLMGFVQMPMAMYLIFISTKYITSAEVSLFTTIETTMAPIWLWIFLQEVPPNMTFIGGAFVILAIFVNTIPKIMHKKQF
jgi:drug/metabolite transporter (DMT)-like permease